MGISLMENSDVCFPSLDPYADNDWIYPSNRYWKYKQILSLLAAGGMDPNCIERIEALITVGYDPEHDQLPTREIIRGKEDTLILVTSIKGSPPSLLRFCRSAIRKHVITVNHNSNLLAKIPIYLYQEQY